MPTGTDSASVRNRCSLASPGGANSSASSDIMDVCVWDTVSSALACRGTSGCTCSVAAETGLSAAFFAFPATLATMSSESHQSRGLLLVISGPSGAGKTTVAREIERRLGGVFSVSVTTRPKTPADREGRDYFFITDAEFNRKRESGELLESAEVFG